MASSVLQQPQNLIDRFTTLRSLLKPNWTVYTRLHAGSYSLRSYWDGHVQLVFVLPSLGRMESCGHEISHTLQEMVDVLNYSYSQEQEEMAAGNKPFMFHVFICDKNQHLTSLYWGTSPCSLNLNQPDLPPSKGSWPTTTVMTMPTQLHCLPSLTREQD